MLKVTSACCVFACIVFLDFSIGANVLFASSQSGSSMPSTQKIDITKSDLFAAKDWDSMQVDVSGFHLGMSRDEASSNAQNHKLELSVTDVRAQSTCLVGDCDVHDAHGLWTSITLRFGSTNRIAEVEITRTPEDAAPAVRKAAVTLNFKGATYSLFNRYSNDLRLKLLGPEGSREVLSRKNPSYQGKVRYEYPLRGVIIFVSANPHGPERTSDLVVSFVPSERHSSN